MRTLMSHLDLTPASEDGGPGIECRHLTSRRHRYVIQNCTGESFNRPLRILVFATSIVSTFEHPLRQTPHGFGPPTQIKIAAYEQIKGES